MEFVIEIMPYSRAQFELKKEDVDIIGPTPYQSEVKEFYTYAQELDFNIPVKTDVYVTDKNKLADISKLKIGVPFGNEKFASEMLGIPIENFYVGRLENLLKMLQIGRIDAFWFERASTMEWLKKLMIKSIYYKEFPNEQISAGLAVRSDVKGDELKTRIDKLIRQIDTRKILKKYSLYSEMPTEGIVE